MHGSLNTHEGATKTNVQDRTDAHAHAMAYPWGPRAWMPLTHEPGNSPAAKMLVSGRNNHGAGGALRRQVCTPRHG